MKNKLLVFGLIFSLALNIGILTAIGFRRLGGKKHKSRRKPSMLLMRKKLNLSLSQMMKMKSLRDNIKLGMKRLDKKLDKSRNTLFSLVKENKTDRRKINETLRKISLLQSQLQKTIIDNLLAMKRVFNLKQRKNFFSCIAKRIRGYWRGEHQGMGSDPPLR